MSISVADNFSYQGTKPLDARLKYDTLANMKAVADATMYEGCLAYCEATDKTYQWKSTNTVDADTGKWREFSSGGGGTDDYTDLQNKPQVNSITLNGNKSLSDLGIAPANVADDCYKTGDTAETGIDDADYFPFYDSSATTKKKSLWSNIKSVLKTYFDTIYSTFSGNYNDLTGAPTRETPASGGTTLSLVNTGDMYNWNYFVPTIKTATLNALSTTVTFTNVPTSNVILSVYTSVVGVEYDSISQSDSTVTVIFPTQGSNMNVYLVIQNVSLI